MSRDFYIDTKSNIFNVHMHTYIISTKKQLLVEEKVCMLPCNICYFDVSSRLQAFSMCVGIVFAAVPYFPHITSPLRRTYARAYPRPLQILVGEIRLKMTSSSRTCIRPVEAVRPGVTTPSW